MNPHSSSRPFPKVREGLSRRRGDVCEIEGNKGLPVPIIAELAPVPPRDFVFHGEAPVMDLGGLLVYGMDYARAMEEARKDCVILV